MNEVRVVGLAQSDAFDDRSLILLSVVYNNETFSWFIRMPKYFDGSIQDFVNMKTESIYADIESKLQLWNNLEIKTREIEDIDSGNPIIIPIKKEEIVKPTYPDYYVLRAREYPSIADQLDAFWKGGSALDEMRDKISSIKSKYTINS
jgi:hypothetical protein